MVELMGNIMGSNGGVKSGMHKVYSKQIKTVEKTARKTRPSFLRLGRVSRQVVSKWLLPEKLRLSFSKPGPSFSFYCPSFSGQ